MTLPNNAQVQQAWKRATNPTAAQKVAKIDSELKRMAKQLQDMAAVCQELRRGLL